MRTINSNEFLLSMPMFDRILHEGPRQFWQAKRAVLFQAIVYLIRKMVDEHTTSPNNRAIHPVDGEQACVALSYAAMLRDGGVLRCYKCINKDCETLSCGCKCSEPVNTDCSCYIFLVIAIYQIAFPRTIRGLMECHANRPSELNDYGKEVNKFCERVNTNSGEDRGCLRRFTKEFWSGLLADQEFVESRCLVRFDAVDEFYRTWAPGGPEFEESTLHEVEQRVFGTRLKALEDFERNRFGRTEVLNWRPEYHRRAKELEAEWRAEGGRKVWLQEPWMQRAWMEWESEEREVEERQEEDEDDAPHENNTPDRDGAAQQDDNAMEGHDASEKGGASGGEGVQEAKHGLQESGSD